MAGNIEKVVIQLILQGELRDIHTYNIKEQLFLEYKQEFRFIVNHIDRYNKIPEIDTFKQFYPEFTLEELPEPKRFYVDRLRLKTKYHNIKQFYNFVGDRIKTSEDIYTQADKCINELKDTVEKVSFCSEDRDISYKDSAEERFQKYLKRKEVLGIDGFTCRWDKVNELILGFQKQHLCTIVARPYSGKTWVLCMLACDFMDAGLKPLFITREQPEAEISRRIDSLRYRLNYVELKKGRLSTADESRYSEGMKNIPNDIIINEDAGADGVLSIVDIKSKIDQYLPDIILIDGAMLLNDINNSKEERTRFTGVISGLKQLAKTKNIPIVITWQLKRKGQGVTVDNIFGSDSILQYSDEIMEIKNIKDVPDKKILSFKKVKEGTLGNVYINWNFQTVDFAETNMESSDELIPDSDSVYI